MALSVLRSPAPRYHLMRQFEDLLLTRSVRYRFISPDHPSHILSPRISSDAFVYPGSNPQHAIYLSASDGVALFAVRSPHTEQSEDELEAMLTRALELNANSELGFWKIEKVERSRLCPVHEVTAFMQDLEQAEAGNALIWQTGAIADSQFAQEVNSFKDLRAGRLLPQDAVHVVKNYLHSLGFRKIMDRPTRKGLALLVVLQDEDAKDESWGRFPLQIEVAELLTFRVFFSLNNAAVTAEKAFIPASQELIAMLNWSCSIGFYNYTHASNQLQFTLQLRYAASSVSELESSLAAYYQSAIASYKATVRAIAKLHKDAACANEQIRDLHEYLGEVQGEEGWKRLEYGADRNAFERDLEGMRVAVNAQAAARYLLPAPAYIPASHSLAIQVKWDAQLIPIRTALVRLPSARERIVTSVLGAIQAFTTVSAVPTLDMMYWSEAGRDVVIVPDKGFHSSTQPLFNELANALFAMLDNANTGDCYEIAYEFSDVREICIETHTCKRALLGAKDVLLHPINAPPPLLDEAIEAYRSFSQATFPFTNAILGWTKGLLDDPNAPYYICEDYIYRVCDAELSWADIERIIDLLTDMHAHGLYHWLLSPFTLRITRKSTPSIYFFLPCLQSIFASFLQCIIPQSFTQYIAPEVLSYIHAETGRPGAAADVYSLCQLIAGVKGREMAALAPKTQRVLKMVTAGVNADPSQRPELGEVRRAVLEAGESEKYT